MKPQPRRPTPASPVTATRCCSPPRHSNPAQPQCRPDATASARPRRRRELLLPARRCSNLAQIRHRPDATAPASPRRWHELLLPARRRREPPWHCSPTDISALTSVPRLDPGATAPVGRLGRVPPARLLHAAARPMATIVDVCAAPVGHPTRAAQVQLPPPPSVPHKLEISSNLYVAMSNMMLNVKLDV
jgi:hypothetical protein